MSITSGFGQVYYFIFPDMDFALQDQFSVVQVIDYTKEKNRT